MSKYNGKSHCNDVAFDNLEFIESLYIDYAQRREDIDCEWASLFSKLESIQATTESCNLQNSLLETDSKASKIVEFFRKNGHLFSDTNCLAEPNTSNAESLRSECKNAEDIEMFKKYFEHYCGKIGFEYDHLSSQEERSWLIEKIESQRLPKISNYQATEILQKLIEAEQFEKFLHSRFVGQKRFSIEGGESTLVALQCIINLATESGIRDCTIGMAHRGRLNTLVNILKKPFAAIFSEFNGKLPFPEHFDGDVKYHLGYSHDIVRSGKTCHLSLLYNPSHLEAINPCVMGRIRAKADILNISTKEMLGILIHGDASFCGQGIVAETLSMQNLKGYSVSGVIHIIVNNQVGFTTDSHNSRSTRYCSDSAKGFDIPILHVNGDSPEDVFNVARIAFEYRQRFCKDILIDIVCYRKYGHNEGDDPVPTQPLMYKKISSHPSTVSIYASQLKKDGVLDDHKFSILVDEYKKKLEADFELANAYKYDNSQSFSGAWKNFSPESQNTNTNFTTGIEQSQINSFADILINIPSNRFHERIYKLVTTRGELIKEGSNLDWGSGEYLGFASLLSEGFDIRLSGQDSGRGTFSHRHAELTDISTGEKYAPLKSSNLAGKFNVINSLLSEYAVLGFEYGYSITAPNTLTLWEAQFGDFANGAQIVIDQFISASESKWMRNSGIVLLLPHGYEGQGPEHSSARIERYLQLCAQRNMSVVNCTNPANFFHVLRRQMKMNQRKPLIAFTPKSLLRHKMAVSNISDFIMETKFNEIIRTDHGSSPIKRVILCSGKIYYDILEAINEKTPSISIIRIEQIYPFPMMNLSNQLSELNAQEIIWCQEEPMNMGCFSFVRPLIEKITKSPLTYIGRREASSTACGSPYKHKVQQDKIIAQCISTEKITNGSVIEV